VKVSYLGKENFTYKFHLKGIGYEFVNALRRTIMGKVPTKAIETVRIFKNESVMPDEFIAHRLGLIPILAKDIDEDSNIKLSLKMTGGIVKSGNIETDGIVEIPLIEIPIVVLNKGKTIEMELEVISGIGEEHIKWSPAFVYYRNVPNLIIDKKVDLKEIEHVVDKCPRQLLEKKGKTIILKDEFSCDLCGYCGLMTDYKLKVEPKSDEFILFIEPYGNMEIERIISKSVDIILNEFVSLKEEIKSQK